MVCPTGGHLGNKDGPQSRLAPTSRVHSRPSAKGMFFLGCLWYNHRGAIEGSESGGAENASLEAVCTHMPMQMHAHTNSCTQTPKPGHPSPHLQTEPFKLLSLHSQHALHVPMTHSPRSQKVSVAHLYPSCHSCDAPASFLTQEVSNRNRPTHLCVLTSTLWNMSSPLIFPASLTSVSCPQEGCLIHH